MDLGALGGEELGAAREGAGRHGAPQDDAVRPAESPHGRGDLAAHAQHVLEVRLAVGERRRADGDHGDLRAPRSPLARRWSPSTRPSATARASSTVQAVLHDRRAPGGDAGHLLGVDVHADHVVAVAGEAGRRDGAHVAQPEDANPHRCSTPSPAGRPARAASSPDPSAASVSCSRRAASAGSRSIHRHPACSR